VGEDKTSLDIWRKSMEVWAGTSNNPNAPLRVLSIFENGGVLNDINDFKRQQERESPDEQIQQPDPLSMDSLAKQIEGWKKLKQSRSTEGAKA
jgi:hypothetical protein